MEFRLIYDGPLSSNGGAAEKQAIRRQLHPQLVELWKTHPVLIHTARLLNVTVDNRLQSMDLEKFANMFKVAGFRFIPLISDDLMLRCELEMLFLRREEPGKLINKGGDIDNRLKTLFDGLRMPHSGPETGNDTPLDGEDPFHCLLKDDSLISGFKVITDRLLRPSSGDHSDNNVLLVIGVKVQPTRPSLERNISFV